MCNNFLFKSVGELGFEKLGFGRFGDVQVRNGNTVIIFFFINDLQKISIKSNILPVVLSKKQFFSDECRF